MKKYPVMEARELRECRAETGMTQEKYADFLRLHPRTYQRMENGQTAISAAMTEYIAMKMHLWREDMFSTRRNASD